MPDAAARILLLDDDRVFARALAGRLRADGYDVVACPIVDKAFSQLGSADILIVEPDVLGSRDEADAWLRDIRRSYAKLATIILTAHGRVDAAVDLVRDGSAIDYLTKPVTDETLSATLDRALRQQRLLRDVATDTREPGDRFAFGTLLGRDLRMLRLFDLVDAVAASRSTVLIVGESGTGKSVLARALHARSPRREKPFIELACGSLPETLLEGELFGHVRGAFTGAIADKLGRFAAADGGTIFLDEINSATPLMQVKLLRVLQERAFEPVGSNETRTVDTRTILATNADLGELVARGAFRQDLFYRINVVVLHLPPLRERIADVPMLSEHFLEKYRAQTGRQTLGFSDEALATLQRYAWPGNVRELENAVERAVVLCRRATIDVSDLPDAVAKYVAPRPRLNRRADDSPSSALTLDAALLAPERRIIEAALKRNGWSRQATARELGIDRTTLYKKMRRHGLGADRNAA